MLTRLHRGLKKRKPARVRGSDEKRGRYYYLKGKKFSDMLSLI
jgi:hypothetical protein